MNTVKQQETYHLSAFSTLSFDSTVEQLIGALKEEGFGIVTTIDIRETFKRKLNSKFRNYIIFGACNPRLAYEAIQEEDKLGVFLPCNVVVQEHDSGKVEVSIINPEETMKSVGNLNLKSFATQIRQAMVQVLKKIDH